MTSMDGFRTTDTRPLARRIGRTVATGAAMLGLLLALAAPSHAATFELLVSASPDRSAPAPLDGGTAQGRIHVFVAPEAGASQVRFWLDNPIMSGTPRRT